MKELVWARVKIPDIKRVVIIDAKDANSDIKKFFEYCIPANIQYLWVNHYASSNNQIHMKYYINSFLKSIKSVSKEVFIEFFLLTASDLQQIVKASHHVERLVFKSWTIRCSGTLNFKSKSTAWGNLKWASWVLQTEVKETQIQISEQIHLALKTLLMLLLKVDSRKVSKRLIFENEV